MHDQRSERRVLVEGSIATALGAGSGTVLAIAFGMFWFLGALLGAAIGFLAYRPIEVLRVTAVNVAIVVRVVRSGGAFQGISDTLSCFGEIARAILSAVLLIAIGGAGWYISGMAFTALDASLGIYSRMLEFPSVAPLTTLFFGGIALGISWTLVEICAIAFERTWKFPLSKALMRACEHGSARLAALPQWYRTLPLPSSPKNIAALFLIAMTVAVIPFALPLLAIIVSCAWIADLLFVAVLVLTSSARLAACEGAFVGSLLGYALHVRAHASAPAATCVGVLTGIAVFHVAYRIRRVLDHRTAPAAA